MLGYINTQEIGICADKYLLILSLLDAPTYVAIIYIFLYICTKKRSFTEYMFHRFILILNFLTRDGMISTPSILIAQQGWIGGIKGLGTDFLMVLVVHWLESGCKKGFAFPSWTLGKIGCTTQETHILDSIRIHTIYHRTATEPTVGLLQLLNF